MFVDRVEIEVQAGRGGDGCVCFRREKYIPRGGPNGGDGGDGGSIILRAEQHVDSLAYVGHKHQWRAANGENGRGADCHGRSAQDTIIPLPPGTLIIDTRGGGFVLKDLVNVGDEIIAAQGGHGGKGNTRFKTATNRAPRQFTPGGEGELRRLWLELKVIADVGLIGKPNAGKSTLLSRLSRARPEIADYPFTTKFPNLGIVQIDLDRSFVMADIPGLIEGAHSGVGLGHEFLRHVERAGILVHLVEPLPTDGTDPLTNYRAIRQELARYDARLAERPEITVVTKSELPGSEELRASLAAETGAEVLAISAVTGQSLNLLTRRIAAALAERNDRAAAATARA
jgi:GTP-binding protein